MPRYYQFGSQRPRYAGVYDAGFPAQGHRAPPDAMGDVLYSGYMQIPADADPYKIHKATYERPAHFFVPANQSPYYLHKYGRVPPGQTPNPMGMLEGLSNMEKNALMLGALGLGAWFLLRKGGALRKPAPAARRRKNPGPRTNGSPQAWHVMVGNKIWTIYHKEFAKRKAKRLAQQYGTPAVIFHGKTGKRVLTVKP